MSFNDVQEFASEHNLKAMETSALHNTNVDEAFQELIEEAYRKLKVSKQFVGPFKKMPEIAKEKKA